MFPLAAPPLRLLRLLCSACLALIVFRSRLPRVRHVVRVAMLAALPMHGALQILRGRDACSFPLLQSSFCESAFIVASLCCRVVLPSNLSVTSGMLGCDGLVWCSSILHACAVAVPLCPACGAARDRVTFQANGAVRSLRWSPRIGCSSTLQPSSPSSPPLLPCSPLCSAVRASAPPAPPTDRPQQQQRSTAHFHHRLRTRLDSSSLPSTWLHRAPPLTPPPPLVPLLWRTISQSSPPPSPSPPTPQSPIVSSRRSDLSILPSNLSQWSI